MTELKLSKEEKKAIIELLEDRKYVISQSRLAGEEQKMRAIMFVENIIMKIEKAE